MDNFFFNFTISIFFVTWVDKQESSILFWILIIAILMLYLNLYWQVMINRPQGRIYAYLDIASKIENEILKELKKRNEKRKKLIKNPNFENYYDWFARFRNKENKKRRRIIHHNVFFSLLYPFLVLIIIFLFLVLVTSAFYFPHLALIIEYLLISSVVFTLSLLFEYFFPIDNKIIGSLEGEEIIQLF